VHEHIIVPAGYQMDKVRGCQRVYMACFNEKKVLEEEKVHRKCSRVRKGKASPPPAEIFNPWTLKILPGGVVNNSVRSCQGIQCSSTESASACFMIVAKKVSLSMTER
jgi:hypothetical protein